jgi:hypothetical protein
MKAEAEAAARGETLPPVANPSPAMQLYLTGLVARQARQKQRQVADMFNGSANVAADILTRSVNAVVADMHWCIDNLDKIRVDVGDSRHSDWSDFWEADYRKTKPWAKNTFVPRRLVLGTNSMWAPFYGSCCLLSFLASFRAHLLSSGRSWLASVVGFV